ncbi:hypothetical protein MMC25_005711 [Agyrium rufum]|nr:hypothetical protein [Agyrium rufum]
MAGSSWWKTIIIPPTVALLLYLLLVHVLIPAYHRRAQYANYLPLDSTAAAGNNLINRAGRNINRFLSRFRQKRIGREEGDVDDDPHAGFLSDEELDEDFIPQVPRGRTLGRVRSAIAENRRLSRDLEVGFKDDSDDGSADERES